MKKQTCSFLSSITLTVVVFLEMGSHYVALADFKFPDSSDLTL